MDPWSRDMSLTKSPQSRVSLFAYVESKASGIKGFNKHLQGSHYDLIYDKNAKVFIKIISYIFVPMKSASDR